ncbi:MAG: pyridoxal phosphate-dependent aminotransferase family protein, partial [Bacteroidetes bacterium]|nr:pyridoxal phosphate-dependent aminotransferase family protein [Bacteroidota bacterium]
SNNYLGLANDNRVKLKALQAILDFGLSMCATPIAGGYCKLLNEAEKRLSLFTGVEDCVLFPSCYHANLALFQTIVRKNDLILVDHYAHSSLVQGIRCSGVKFRPFLHNNIENLESVLSGSGTYDQVFVVTESVFSTEGTIAPLQEMNLLCDKYNAVFVVDDSHGIGVIGNMGKGAVSMMPGFGGIVTASLGKALAGSGGMIGTSSKLMEYFRYYCPQLVYSTAIVPPVLGGILAVLDIIEQEYESIAEKMYGYKRRIEKALDDNGFVTIKNRTPVISVASGDSVQTINLSCAFHRKKILTTPFVHPSVPEKHGRLRLIPGANLKEETIDKVINLIPEIASDIKNRMPQNCKS